MFGVKSTNFEEPGNSPQVNSPGNSVAKDLQIRGHLNGKDLQQCAETNEKSSDFPILRFIVILAKNGTILLIKIVEK